MTNIADQNKVFRAFVAPDFAAINAVILALIAPLVGVGEEPLLAKAPGRIGPVHSARQTVCAGKNACLTLIGETLEASFLLVLELPVQAGALGGLPTPIDTGRAGVGLEDAPQANRAAFLAQLVREIFEVPLSAFIAIPDGSVRRALDTIFN